MRDPTRDLAAVAGFLTLAAVMGVESCSDTYQGSGAGLAQDAVFFPRLVIGAIAVLALSLGVRTIMAGGRPTDHDPVARPPWSWRRAGGLALACCVYVGLMPVIGFLLATLVFSLVTPAILGSRNSRVALLVALLFPAGAWLLFAWMIRIPLPVGQLPWLS